MLTLAFCVVACAALPQSKPADRPKATLELDPKPWEYRFKVEIVTASGQTYAMPFDIQATVSVLARDSAFAGLLNANWLVDRSDDFGIHVYGVRAKGGGTDPVKSLVVIVGKEKERDLVTLTGTDGVKVATREPGGKLAADPPPRGPDLGPESYVEFDFTPVPCERGPWEMARTVETTLKDFTANDDFGAPNGTTREHACESFVASLGEMGFKAEVIEKSKVRVYGGLFDGKFYPATRGIVTSPNLKKDQLPKVTNPPKA